jgi:hypothetical protein
VDTVHESRPQAEHRADGPAYEAFVAELAAGPDSVRLLKRLRSGHRPDEFGWCAHHSHSYRWERFPCSTLRLAGLVEQTILPARRPGTPLRAVGP